MNIRHAGRTLNEFQPLKPAEQKLLDACRQGIVALISAECPAAANDDNTVHAAFLRFLALGGDEQTPVHERGIRLYGAWITGKLDMESTAIPSDLGIGFCHFDTAPVFRGAKIAGTLNLSGCRLPGLEGDRLACDGGLFLQQSFIATGEVRLHGAQIGGNLECGGAKFDDRDGYALTADGVVIKGNVFLNDGCTATGTVRLVGAKIGGSLDCRGAKFDGSEGFALLADNAEIQGNVFLNQGFAAIGTVRVNGVQIGGNLECIGAKFDSMSAVALSAQGMVVNGILFFRNLVQPVNGVSLASSHVGYLADDKNSWGNGLVLDGFTYGSIIGDVPTDAATRLAWLDKQRQKDAGLDGDGADFKRRPWLQLAKVLREMGQAEDARQIMIAYEHRLRKANLIGHPPKHWGKLSSTLYRQVTRMWHWFVWMTTGYGYHSYRPGSLLVSMVVMWLLCGALYWCAAMNGVFAPSNPLIFQNPEYAVCRPDYLAPASPIKAASAVQPTIQGAGNWYLCEKLREEYSGFSPLAYSLDVILPLVDLQQESSWSPLIQTPNPVWYKELLAICDWKHITRLVLWFEILFGWVYSVLLVAEVSGLTKRREE